MDRDIHRSESSKSPPLVTVVDFIKEHRPPICIRWAIQKHDLEMTRLGVITRYGKKILIHPDNFWKWLLEREGGKK